MNLYDRDYSQFVSQEEIDAIAAYEAYETAPGIKTIENDPRFSHHSDFIKDFLWHHLSSFPNNHLNPITVRHLDLRTEAAQFRDILERANNEQQVQRYIKDNRKWFIPASIYKEYNFGHHGAYIFPEQRFGAEYSADYVLLGQNSDGYSIVFIEFENPNCPFILQNQNTESNDVRKGLAQVRDWKRWLDANRTYFLQSIGFMQKNIIVPTARIFYCIVVSRRSALTDAARELRSQLIFEERNLKIISYDRIVDNITKLVNGY